MERNPSERIEEIVSSLMDEPETGDPKATRRRRRPWSVGTKIIALAVVLLMAGTVYAAVSILTHTFPASPAGVPVALTSTCTSLVEQSAAPVVGTSGGIRYDCGGTTTAAAALTVSATGSVIPAFVLPTGATGLTLVAHVTMNAGCSGGTALATNVAVSLTALATFDYCVLFTAYASTGIGTFTVTWSQ